ncbi:MAG: hypothetical protein IKD45_02725 [Clostridia bacterium]|nr:hypothetical protein [Clostridia bacterium]
MQNSEFKEQNKTKAYAVPEIETVRLSGSDVITASGGTETPWVLGSPASWG